LKIYVAAVEALRKEGMKLSLPPKLVEKLVWVPVILFCKISFPVPHFMPYYAKTGRSHPLIAGLKDSKGRRGREAFSIHPSRHPSIDGIIQGRKPWQK
jgi:hypothetical protein